MHAESGGLPDFYVLRHPRVMRAASLTLPTSGSNPRHWRFIDRFRRVAES